MLHSLCWFFWRFLIGVLSWGPAMWKISPTYKPCFYYTSEPLQEPQYFCSSSKILQSVWSDQAAPILTTERCHSQSFFCKTTQSVALFCRVYLSHAACNLSRKASFRWGGPQHHSGSGTATSLIYVRYFNLCTTSSISGVGYNTVHLGWISLEIHVGSQKTSNRHQERVQKLPFSKCRKM